ncbi:hypothetical protein AKJ57_00820 [candidate division MSBL1 archaeon SCGC-AAA259A05]|uniref:Pyrrolo-quinoline quinone n=1 Tax=candidate division MSBL1 archaeon SCGC-AAA259A05 TaxID=1698259 RepID=A0A133UBH0_9EURY|nr:hypothetical protein AKJ57_00820 [candidate division MSBL1 archaeon SCGC-AAA259A05]
MWIWILRILFGRKTTEATVLIHTPVIYQGKVFYGTTTYEVGSPDYIYARDEEKGNLVWSYKINTDGNLQGIFSQPEISGRRLYIAADDGFLPCFLVSYFN